MQKIKKRRSRRDRGYISFIVDETETVDYIRNDKRYRRKYICIMHRNNNVGKYWAGFGYWHKKKVKYLWMKTGTQFDFLDMKNELMHRFHNHVEILMGQLKLVRVKQSIIDEGGLPGTIDGNALPVEEGYDVFKIVKKVDDEFDTIIEGLDGRQFQVARECFDRARPVNWIENRYSEG